MNKSEFLNRLERALAPLGGEERQRAIGYWPEYIDEASAQMSEEEAVARIGTPEDVAARTLAEAGIEGKRRERRPASFWILCVLASPIAIPLLAAGFAVAFAIAVTIVVLVLVLLMLPALVAVTLAGSGLWAVFMGTRVLADTTTFTFFIGVGLAGVGAGGLVAMYYLPMLPRAFRWIGRHVFRRGRKAA